MVSKGFEKVLKLFLACCYAVPWMFYVVPSMVEWLLGSEVVLACCYAVARVFWLVARWLLRCFNGF